MKSKSLNLIITLDALLQESNVTLAAKRLGLSTPATSHALARIRKQYCDPILTRAGRTMVLTPLAEQLRPQVRNVVEEATRVLNATVPFSPHELKRCFTIYATDHVLSVLGLIIDRIVSKEAPDVCLRFLPSVVDDWIALRDGTADLSVCMLGHFPQEFLTRKLFTERYVCVVRQDHPKIRKRLNMDDYLKRDHVIVSPMGETSPVDTVLAERGYKRRICRIVPYFLSGLHLVATTDYILTISERAASSLAPMFTLRIIEPPFQLAQYTLNLMWHPRLNNDPANQWLREVFYRAAKEVAEYPKSIDK